MGKPEDEFETTARVPFQQLRPDVEIVDERQGATLTCLTQPRLGYVFRLNRGETVIGRAEEAYPDVAVFVFSPTPRDLEKMSGTMMRFLTRTEIEQMAFESAAARIRTEHAWLAEDLRRHGFDLER